jgi:hypothetical protein
LGLASSGCARADEELVGERKMGDARGSGVAVMLMRLLLQQEPGRCRSGGGSTHGDLGLRMATVMRMRMGMAQGADREFTQVTAVAIG